MLDNYNERLFSGKGFRSKLHFARYLWFRNKVKEYKCPADTVLELGCFDGKTIEFLQPPPKQYDGYDANWEGGLDIGIDKWKNYPNYHFKLCTKISDFQPPENYFDVSVCQETIEHLPLADTEKYIAQLAKATKGYCFISVPNEKGIVFLIKHMFKALTQPKGDREDYSFAEIFYSTIGNIKKVERHETGHKGFDYSALKKDLQKYFDVVETNGLPFTALPVSLNFTVGFVCKRKAGSK
jgi:Methyltransferase domain